MSLELAARIDDPVVHSNASKGAMIAGAAVDIALLFVPGPEEVVIVKYVYRGGRILRWAVKRAVRAANEKLNDLPKEMAKKGAEKLGEKLGESSFSVAGYVVEGSDDVFTNQRKAARVEDKVDCDESKIAMGSDCVTINRKPAVRRTDPTLCGGIVADGSEDVIFGGVPVSEVGGLMGEKPKEKHDESWWMDLAMSSGKGAVTGAVKGGTLSSAAKGALDGAKDVAKSQTIKAGRSLFTR